MSTGSKSSVLDDGGGYGIELIMVLTHSMEDFCIASMVLEDAFPDGQT